MLPTHALFGMLLALPVAMLVPEYAPVALGAGLAGGVLPDLDLYTDHRKRLHYPVWYSVVAVSAAGVALVRPSAVTVGVALLFAAAASHCLADVFGGGLELRPWEGTSDRAVYNHYRGRWITPRRWVRYDGAPEDFLLSLGLAAALWPFVDAPFRSVAIAGVIVAGVYAATRRILPRIASLLFGGILPRYVPASVLTRVPERYLADSTDGASGQPTGQENAAETR